MNHPYFSLYRIWLLLRIDIRLTIGYLSMSLLIPLLFFWLMSLNPVYNVHHMLATGLNMMKAYILIGGVIFTSFAFTEMHQRPENHLWFMLPANPLEKFSAKWLLTLVYFFLFFVIGFFIVKSIGQLFFLDTDEYFVLFNPASAYFTHTLWPAVSASFLSYLVYHAIFLLGASFFRNRVVIKTFLSLFAMAVIIVLAIIYLHRFGFIDLLPQSISGELHYNFIYDFTHLTTPILTGLVLLLWTLAFISMKRTQLS